MEKLRFAPLLLGFLALGCSPSMQEPSAPSLLSGSSYGSSAPSSFSAPSGPSIPRHGDSHGALVVRPDLACVPFVLRVEMADAKAALDLLEKTTLVIKERFGAATGGAATTAMLGANTVAAGSHAKVKEDDPAPPRFVVTVDGAVEVPLAAEAGYWARAKLVAGLVEASRKFDAVVPSGGEGAPKIEVAFGAPEIKLRDPESFRPELVKRWVERARAFARVVESERAPLHLVSCEPPNAITQTHISLEKVGLALPVSCRIDVAPTTR
ncbi:hypothetical protein [Polyangium spumosum]|uniref:DUF541 domain-containing protein n=1 Tax=Polyangium spumosum TaxID=889282 RepID=A0A6N7PIV6_9BACT|nr:hypothetical protein [Polyangium spumosum]MRG92042.1 hypothetical protein [Polyangium spumosum]